MNTARLNYKLDTDAGHLVGVEVDKKQHSPPGDKAGGPSYTPISR